MTTSKEPSGTTNIAKNRQKGDFKGDNSLDGVILRLWERLKVFWTLHMSGYLKEPTEKMRTS